MSHFGACWTFTLAQEGGFADDPQDPGGATNWGITLTTLRHFRGDRNLGVQAIRDLTMAQAAPIARALYWRPMDCEALPPGADLMVFDFGFNAGPGTSAEMLQRQVGADVDGDIGPLTVLATRGCDRVAVILGLADRQTAYYRGLADFPRFGDGWLRRTRARRDLALSMAGAPPATTA